MKPISDFLQQLIDEANTAIEKSQITIKEKLLSVYQQAKQEGFEPKEARKLMEEKITAVSDRYVRQVLPDEAKQQQDHSIRQLVNKPLGGTVPPEALNNTPPVPTETQDEITNPDTIQEPHTTFEYHKASDDEQEKYFRMDSEIDKYKKLAFDKQQIIEEKDIQIERLTNQVESQAEAIKQNITQGEQPKIFPFTLPNKSIPTECPKCHYHRDIMLTGRVYNQNSWIAYPDNIEAQKQQTQKWRNV